MSFQAMAWAVRQSVGDDQAKHLLLTLANFANDEGKAWPSVTRLTKDTEMSRRTIFRKLDVLAGKGLIDREQKVTPAGTYSVYTLKGWCQPDTTSVTEAPAGVTLTRGGGVRLTPKPVEIEPIKEPITGKNIGDRPVDELMRVLSEETAQAIVDHRKAKKAPLTMRAAKDLAARLAEYHDPEAAASEMMVRGWTGFKSEWMHNTTAQRKPAHDKRSEFLAALDGSKADVIDGEFTVESPGRGLRVVS